ncbi:MAG: glycosyltransferase family 4 protein [Candidatus Rokubacteria bacterium]|nr:glycosyltransferase family 4 protein [Candidatus Rokubacteria bacterium]
MTGRVALLTPFAFPSVRGNAVTVDRIARGLANRGVELRVWDVGQTPEATIADELGDCQPSLVHAFHAWRVGPLALKLARRAEIPLVVTLTGTDANHDLFDPARAAAVRRVLEGAAATVAFHESIAARIRATLPDVGARLVVIPQAADLESHEPYRLAARWPMPPDRVLFLFPGGIRPVKNPRMPLEPLGRLAARDPRVRLAYAGPVLDRAEGDAVRRAIQGLSWVRHLGTVPHHQMASLLQRADVVLNCSVSEGGMANSMLEALSLGRAVLASAIDGNRSLVEDGVTGFLFRDDRELEVRAEQLARDPGLRERLGRAGRARVRSEYPASREINGYLDVYRRLVPVPTT